MTQPDTITNQGISDNILTFLRKYEIHETKEEIERENAVIFKRSEKNIHGKDYVFLFVGLVSGKGNCWWYKVMKLELADDRLNPHQFCHLLRQEEYHRGLDRDVSSLWNRDILATRTRLKRPDKMPKITSTKSEEKLTPLGLCPKKNPHPSSCNLERHQDKQATLTLREP